MQEHRNSLQPGYRLHWYVIKKILGQGGFGITYLAEDTNLNQEVAIKEYLPVELAMREQFSWGLDRFMSEAQTLAQFKHSNIVRVLTVFPENNTAYMIMEYENGQAMHELLKKRKTLSENEIKLILLPILDGLEQVHKAGFIHRDIKPPNIFIRTDGSPVLLDFGSARHALGEQTRTLTSLVSPGFAPFEQYVSKSDKQGPWTDIYGLGATLYRSAVGRSPAEAMDRSEALLHTSRDSFVGAAEINPDGYSKYFLEAIDHALAFKSDERPQSVGQWRAELTQSSSEELFAEAATLQIPPSNRFSAENLDDQNSASTTIKTEALTSVGEEAGIVEKPRRWYRKPIKVLAVVFGILFLLAILDDENKKNTNEKQVAEEPDITENLLQEAAKDVHALRLTSPEGNNALEKYHQVLDRNPDNEAAQTGIKNVADKYLQLAGRSLRKMELPQASTYVDKAESLYSAHPQIQVLRNTIARQQTQKQVSDRVIGDTLPTKSTDLIDSSERRKLARIQRQLARNPGNQQAKQELRKLASKYESSVKKALQEKNYNLAETYVLEMLEIAPDNKKLQESLKVIRAGKDTE